MASTVSTIRPDRYRVSFLLTPKPGLSLEEFRRYWVEQHVPLFRSLSIVKKNLLKYEQFHIDNATTTALAAEATGNSPPPFGGVAIFESDTLEKLLEVFKDEEYLRVAVPDEEKFLDRSKFQILAGHYATSFDVE